MAHERIPFTRRISPMFRDRFSFRWLLAICALLFLAGAGRAVAADQSAIARIKERGVLRWGSDAEGGAPYVFPDPKNPSRLIGFELDIVEAIAKRLGVRARLVQTAWDSLIPALERGDYDMAMNGLEITPEREKRVLFSRPYYVYTLQSYSAAWPYEDLALGRLDAVFLDTPIAAYYGRPDPRLKYAGPPEGGGFYGNALRKEDRELRKVIDAVIEDLLRTGGLKRIYEEWGLWDEAQSKLISNASSLDAGQLFRNESADVPLYSFLPPLLNGTGITIILSVVSMALAISLGVLLAVTRFYDPPFIGGVATAYVEIYRGTPS